MDDVAKTVLSFANPLPQPRICGFSDAAGSTFRRANQDVCFSADGRLALCLTHNPRFFRIVVVDVDADAVKTNIPLRTSEPHAVAWVDASRFVVALSARTEELLHPVYVREYDATTGRPTRQWSIRDEDPPPVFSVDVDMFSPDGRLIAACESEEQAQSALVVNVRDVRTSELVASVRSRDQSGDPMQCPRPVAWFWSRTRPRLLMGRGEETGYMLSLDGLLLVDLGEGGKAKAKDVEERSATTPFALERVGEDRYISHVAVSCDDAVLAVSFNCALRVYDAESGRHLRTLLERQTGGYQTFAPSGRLLAAIVHDARARYVGVLYDADRGCALRSLGPATHLCWAGSERICIAWLSSLHVAYATQEHWTARTHSRFEKTERERARALMWAL